MLEHILISILFLAITILGLVTFGIRGLLTLLITVPLIIIYYKLNNIIKLTNKKEKINNKILFNRKEVEFVSSRDRKKRINLKKEKTNNKKVTSKKNRNRNRNNKK